jgi:translocation and assembly module TamB
MILLIALLLLGAAVIWLRSEAGAGDLCTLARRQLPALLGLDVGIGRCELDPLTRTVTLHGLSLFVPGEEVPVLAVDRAEVRVGAVRPLFGSVELEQVRVVRPRITVDLSRPSDSRKKRSSACSLEVLERLGVAHLDVRDAEVHLRFPGDRWVELLGGEITGRQKRGKTDLRIRAQQGRVSPRPGVELEVSQLELDGRLSPGDDRLEVGRAELDVAGLSFSGGGDIEGLCDPELRLEGNLFVPMKTVAQAASISAPVDGHVWARLGATGKASSPVLTAEVAGDSIRIGRYEPGSFQARLSMEGTTLRVEQLDTDAGAGKVRVKATMELSSRLPVTAEAEVEDAQFGAILARAGLPGAWVDFPSNGKVHLKGALLPTPDLRADVDIKTGAFVLAKHAWDAPESAGKLILGFDRAHATGTVRILSDRVDFEAMRIAGPDSTVLGKATLNYDPAKGMTIRGEAPQLDFDDFRHIAGIHWSGKGSGTFEIAGPYTSPAIEADVALHDFDFWRFSLGVLQGHLEYKDKVLSFPSATGQRGRTQYFGSGELRFENGQILTRADATVPHGRTADLVEMLMPMHENVAVFQGTLDGEVSAAVEVHGPAETFEGTVDLQLARTRYYDRRLGDGRALLRFVGGQKMVLEPVVLKGPLGTTTADGTWDFDGPLDYRFRVDGGSLAELVGPEYAKGLDLDAPLALVGKVSGSTDLPVTTATLTSPAVHLAGRNLGSTQLEGRWAGRDIEVSGRLFDGARASLELKAREPFPWSGSATVSLPEIRSLLPEGAISRGLSGSISGSLQGRGTLRDLRGTEAAAKIDRVAIARHDFRASNESPVDLSLSHGVLKVDNFVLRGPNTMLSIAGSAAEQALDLDLHGTFDLRLLESFVSQLERSSGIMEVTAAAGGTLEHPSFTGTAELKDARTSLKDYPVSLRGLSGRMEFSEARVLVHDVHGVLNDGRVALRGDIRLEHFLPRRLDINVQLDEVSARPLDSLPLTASGELLLVGPPDALVLSGSMDIVKLRYDQPLVLESLLSNIRTARVEQLGGGGEGPRREWLNFDLGIHASGDIRVDNNLARARLRGDLQLTGTNLQPGLVGSIESMEGSQIFFRGNQFAVSQAVLDFKDRHDIDPVFDLHAQSQVREYLVILHGFGRLRDPQVILSSDPGLGEGDILSLLTLGVTSRDQSSAMGTTSVIGEAVFNASGLDRQIQRFLPKSPILRDLNFHVASSYNEASGLVEPTAQLESRFLTERLKLQMSQPVVTNRGTRAQAEYHFHDRLLGQLQWDNDAIQDLPNFGVDLKLKWEVE